MHNMATKKTPRSILPKAPALVDIGRVFVPSEIAELMALVRVNTYQTHSQQCVKALARAMRPMLKARREAMQRKDTPDSQSA